MNVAGTLFNGPPVKHESAFDSTVLSAVKKLANDGVEEYKIFFGWDVEGEPVLHRGGFHIDTFLNPDEELDAHSWNVSVSEMLLEEEVIPTYMAIVSPVCTARFEGDQELADFYAIYTMTWLRHEVTLMPVDEVTNEQGEYAVERFTDDKNDGPLEEMAEIAREYVLRKG